MAAADGQRSWVLARRLWPPQTVNKAAKTQAPHASAVATRSTSGHLGLPQTSDVGGQTLFSGCALVRPPPSIKLFSLFCARNLRVVRGRPNTKFAVYSVHRQAITRNLILNSNGRNDMAPTNCHVWSHTCTPVTGRHGDIMLSMRNLGSARSTHSPCIAARIAAILARC